MLQTYWVGFFALFPKTLFASTHHFSASLSVNYPLWFILSLIFSLQLCLCLLSCQCVSQLVSQCEHLHRSSENMMQWSDQSVDSRTVHTVCVCVWLPTLIFFAVYHSAICSAVLCLLCTQITNLPFDIWLSEMGREGEKLFRDDKLTLLALSFFSLHIISSSTCLRAVQSILSPHYTAKIVASWLWFTQKKKKRDRDSFWLFSLWLI